MSEHAKLSPSAFGRWGKCPGSVRLCKDLPNKSSAAAQWGTDAHSILEDLLVGGDEDLPLFADFEEKHQVATVALNYVEQTVGQYDEDNITNKVSAEMKVYPEYYTGEKNLWGSADVTIETDYCLEIIDLKAGAGIMVESDSSQLKIYALGAMAVQAKINKGVLSYEEILCTIVQPRIPHPDGVVRSTSYTVEDLENWNTDVLRPAIAATKEVDAPLVPGEEQCRFCTAKATCPAIAAKSENLAMSVFEDQTNKQLENIVEIDIKQIPLEKIIEIIEAAPLIEGWLKAVKAHAVDMLKNREPVGDYKLVRTNGRNGWTLPQDELVEEITKGKGRILKNQLMKEVVVSAPQMLKAKGLSPAQKKRLGDYIVKSEGSLAMVPSTDKRSNAFPAIEFNDVSFLD